MGYKNKTDKRNYQKEWIKKKRAKYLTAKRCHFCDTDKNIEIHHINPEEKTDHRIWSWSDKRIKAELLKCIFLCKSCHDKFHSLTKRVPLIHGTSSGYNKYKCRCPLCRAWKSWHKNKCQHEARIVRNGWRWFVKEFCCHYGITESDVNRITGYAV